MARNFSDAERLVAMAVSARPVDTANENDIEAGAYMRPIADAVLRDNLSEAAMASLGHQLLQQYIADTKALADVAKSEIDEQQVEDRRHARSDYRELASDRLH